MLQFEAPKENSNYIKVIGVGGGGTNAINHMYNKGIEGVDFIVCNTDRKSLDASPVQNKIKIGKDGLGAGNCPEKARIAAQAAEEEIKSMLSNNTQMLFIAAGMGGGTGTGAAPVIAKIAKEIEFKNEEGEKLEDEILVVAIVTLPLSFEGKRRKEQAEEGIRNLKEVVDAIIVVNTDKIRERGNIPLPRMFPLADDVLLTAAKGIAEIITSNAYIMVDFRDVQSVMSHSGVAIMGTGTGYGSGEERALAAIEQAATSDLLNDCEIKGTKNMLLYITTSPEEEYSITMDEYSAIADYLHSQTDNEPDIIWGLRYDETYKDRIDITLVATGFEEKAIYNPFDRNSIEKKVVTISEPKKVEPVIEVKPIEAEVIQEPFIIKTEEVSQQEPELVVNTTKRFELGINPDSTTTGTMVNNETINKEINTIFNSISQQQVQQKPQVQSQVQQSQVQPKVQVQQQPQVRSTIQPQFKQQNQSQVNKDTLTIVDVEEKPADNSFSIEPGFDVRKLHKETQTTNPHYVDNHEKLLAERQKRMEMFSQMMKDKNGLEEIIKTPAYEQYNMDIPVTKHSDSRESSSLKFNGGGISTTNNNPYIHSNPD